MKKSLKKTLLCTTLVVTPIIYTYNVNQDLHKELNNLKTQNRKQQEIIKQFEREQTEMKKDLKEIEVKINESEVRLRRRFTEEFRRIEEEIEQLKNKDNYIYSFDGVVTAYTAGYESTKKHKGHPLYGVTASGTKAKQGRTIAMDKRFPFGTLVKIEGISGVFRVEDRGSKIKVDRIDLYFENVEDAVKFGKQKRKIFIIKLGKSVDKHN